MKKFFPVLEYINLPNLFTTLGLVFGVAACYFLIERDLRGIFICLFFASSMDLLDGFFATKLDQQTLFGQYADALVDFFICCIMPILIVYTFLGSGLLLISSVTFFSICGLWRLAYFNVVAGEKRNYYTGLPAPGAMMLVMMIVWSIVQYDLPVWIGIVAFYLIGLFMVSFIKLVKYALWQKLMWVVGLIFVIVVVVS
jgi:CDP-diacylglycerol--serine O-phosphatidyltransferase